MDKYLNMSGNKWPHIILYYVNNQSIIVLDSITKGKLLVLLRFLLEEYVYEVLIGLEIFY